MKKLKPLCIAFITASVFVASCSAMAGETRSNIKFLNAKLKSTSEPTEISGILAKPEGDGPFPAVVLLHTCGDMRKHVSHEWPAYLTKLGYVTLSPDSAGSRHISGCDGMISDERLKSAFQETAQDAYGALRYLSSLPYIDKDNVAVMGFSFGAQVINAIILKPQFQKRMRNSLGMNFKAGIAFYGSCHLLKKIRQTPFPVIQIIGSNDQKAKECSELGHHSIKVHLIPGAYHTFDSWENSGSRDASGNLKFYDEKATALAREITKDFLKIEMSKPSPSRIPGSPGGVGGRQGPTVGKVMSKMDNDKDGFISKKEFLGPPERFDLLDLNKDGQISSDELNAAIERRKAGKQGGQLNKNQ